jgi:hypothetical protein
LDEALLRCRGIVDMVMVVLYDVVIYLDRSPWWWVASRQQTLGILHKWQASTVQHSREAEVTAEVLWLHPPSEVGADRVAAC